MHAIRQHLCALALLLSLTMTASAQERVVVLKAARLFDGASNDVVANAVVVVEGTRIRALGGAVPAGVTTVRDLASWEYIDVSLRNAINAGYVPGPRMLVALHPIGATGGHGDSDPYPPSRGIPQQGPMQGICSGADECRSAVRHQIKYGADVIKVGMSGGVLSLADSVDLPQMTREEIAAIVSEAHQWERRWRRTVMGTRRRRPPSPRASTRSSTGRFSSPTPWR